MKGVSASKRRRSEYRRILETLAVEERCRGRSFPIVLDFGCGTGWFVSHFSKMGSKVLGVEVRPEALQEARRLSEEDGGEKHLLVLYSGQELPLRDGAVDLILCIGVIRSLMDRGPIERAVMGWHRCLRPRGTLIVVETDNRALRRYLTPREMRRRIEAGGFVTRAWYPVRKVAWWGIRLIKWGLVPRPLYPFVAGWELRMRRRYLWGRGKRAYLGEFQKREAAVSASRGPNAD